MQYDEICTSVKRCRTCTAGMQADSPSEGRCLMYTIYNVAQVAAVSGDARRVLEMCRRAAGFAEVVQAKAAGKLPEAGGEQAAEALRGIVRMGHVDRVVQETANQAHMRLIGTAPRLEKALLACLLMETRATGLSLHPAAAGQPEAQQHLPWFQAGSLPSFFANLWQMAMLACVPLSLNGPCESATRSVSP